jgi:hypothetical protein
MLLGEGWHVLGDAGTAPQPGVIPLTAGTLADTAGLALGDFRSARLGTATLLHTLEFSDGTVFGLGHGGLADADFAIIGGTGQYASATGGYTARQHPTELGGAGTATFDLSIASTSTRHSVLGTLISSSSDRS